jgi:DNA polymerase (family X)
LHSSAGISGRSAASGRRIRVDPAILQFDRRSRADIEETGMMAFVRRNESARRTSSEASSRLVFNAEAARMLRECGDLLVQQQANPFRANAYRHAADTLESLDVDVREILDEKGILGLIALPGIGEGLAAAIDEIARTGRLSRLERLRGAADPETLLRMVPGIGPKLAHRIHEDLHIDTLEALEVAAHDGSVTRLAGVGPRRVAMIQAALARMLGRPARRATLRETDEPSVETLLRVDAQYRKSAAKGLLPTIAPRRFNPEAKAWLPILHTSIDDWHFTALYSNTARAHALRRTQDWVVIYFHGHDHREGQRTVVTETHGPLRGRRVVRGRESESLVP